MTGTDQNWLRRFRGKRTARSTFRHQYRHLVLVSHHGRTGRYRLSHRYRAYRGTGQNGTGQSTYPRAIRSSQSVSATTR
jgi:hypothetical protein